MLGILLKNETVCSLGGSNSKINSMDYKIHPLFDSVAFIYTKVDFNALKQVGLAWPREVT